MITDPRELPDRLGVAHPTVVLPSTPAVHVAMLEPPLSQQQRASVTLEKAPSIGTLPQLQPMSDDLDAVVAIKLGDDVSTDEILPAGARALPYRSNIEKLAEFAFERLDPQYVARTRRGDRHVVVAGRNYGQGSSREHAVIAPRHLGLRMVLAKSYARIHWQNLANFGVLALEFTDDSDYDLIEVGNLLTVDGVHQAVREGSQVAVHNVTTGQTVITRHRLSPRQVDMVLAGGRIPQVRSSGVLR